MPAGRSLLILAAALSLVAACYWIAEFPDESPANRRDADSDEDGPDGDGDVDVDADGGDDADEDLPPEDSGDVDDGGAPLSCSETLDCVVACPTGDVSCVLLCASRVCEGEEALWTDAYNCLIASCLEPCSEWASEDCESCSETYCSTEVGACVAGSSC